jgi:hypothetical protein
MEPEKVKRVEIFTWFWMGNYGCNLPQFYEFSVRCPKLLQGLFADVTSLIGYFVFWLVLSFQENVWSRFQVQKNPGFWFKDFQEYIIETSGPVPDLILHISRPPITNSL